MLSREFDFEQLNLCRVRVQIFWQRQQRDDIKKRVQGDFGVIEPVEPVFRELHRRDYERLRQGPRRGDKLPGVFGEHRDGEEGKQFLKKRLSEESTA